MRAALAGLVVSFAVAGCGRPEMHNREVPPLLLTYGCLSCHVYRGAGASNLGAPALSHEGRHARGIDWQVRHLKCPACVVRGSPMPRFGSLGSHNLRELARFLESSR